MAKAIDTLSIKLDFKTGSGSQQIIDKIGNSIKNLKVIAGQTGPSVDKVRRSINDFTKQGNRSISTIEGQVTALRALRREADINSKEFKELTADIAKYERQLNKAQGRRGGGGARQATQIAGAVISGGIFGGPEGAIGGALGAFGGVQGAFAGAAIGAQVGGLRKSVAAAADYAAEIGKLKIALEGVSKVENDQLSLTERAALSQQNYNSALETAAEATRELNVPQDAAVRGITRLTAAVTGAGGPIGDAETTFKNVTAAIKATGGSTEDVKGAITAMVQVFSKGKVSAEELSGQLGERLPGAVTMFAKANEMTLPQLQKNLKAGTVGLNELMRFVEELGTTFEGTAKKIAGSNEEAGARLSVAIREMQAEIGTALIPIGAQFQDAFGEFIKTITPFLKQALPAIGNLLLGVSKNLDTLAVAAAAAIAALSVIKIYAIVTAIKSLSVAKIALLRRVVLLKKGLAALNLVALANPYVLLAAGAAVLATKIHNAAKEQSRLNLLIREGGVAAIDKEIVEKETKLFAAEKRLQTGNDGDVLYNVPGAGPFTDSRVQDERRSRTLRDQINELKGAKGRARYDATQGAGLDFDSFLPFDYRSPTADGGGSGSGSGTNKTQARIDRADEIVRRLNDQLRIQRSQGEIGKLIGKQAKERSNLEAVFQRLLKEGANEKVLQAQITAKDLLVKRQALELENKTKEVIEKTTKPLEDITKNIHEKIRADKEYARLIAEGINPELAKQLVEINKQFLASRDLLDVQIEQAKASLLKLQREEGTEEAIRAQIQAIKDLEDARKGLPGKKKDAEGAAGEAYKKPTIVEGLKTEISNLQDELDKLLDPVNQITGAANAIGTAFTDSFRSVIDGSATTQEALASFFKNIGNYFLDMAMQIIQKMITMYILNTVLKVLPGFSNGGVFNPGAPSITGNKIGDFGGGTPLFAKGGAFAKNKIVPYAKGGIVNKPTMFAYANGGAGRFGIMGEAGPEAILPLQRGPGGKLGVQASGGGVGNVVVNVDASGSSVEGDPGQASQLGKRLGSAVQAELIKQKRPGGLLAS